MSKGNNLDNKTNKRRALEPAPNNCAEMDFEQLKGFIAAQNQKLHATIEINNKNNLQSMEQILNGKLDQFAGYIESKIEKVRVECADSIKGLSDEVAIQVHQLNVNRLDFLERRLKQCYVIVRNIPYRSDENMRNFVYDICDAIQFSNVDSIKSAFRMSRSTNKSNPIVIKFYDKADKGEFMRAYFKYNKLNLSDLGFRAKFKVIICEALTPKNNEIFKKAMSLKHNKKIFSVSTKNGFVYYRLNSKSQLVKASSLSSLDAFLSIGAKTNENGSSISTTDATNLVEVDTTYGTVTDINSNNDQQHQQDQSMSEQITNVV